MLKQAMDFFAKALKKEKGFTLVELLATLVIIGVIAAIAVPSIGNVVENSKNKAKVAEALMIIDAAKTARAEHPDQIKWISNNKGKNDLNGYLENVKDNTWNVTWSKDSGYQVSGHDANTVVGKDLATEQDLVDATK